MDMSVPSGSNTNDRSQDLERDWIAFLFRLAQFGLSAISQEEDVLDMTGFVKLGSFVGGGGFAEVYKAEWEKSPESLQQFIPTLPELAIKVVRVPLSGNSHQRGKSLKQLKREVSVWRTLQHKNILKLVGVAYLGRNTEEPALISLYMPHGNLKDYLLANQQADKYFFMVSIAEGLAYLHNHDPEVIHGDLKALNILVDKNGNPCLSDFGLSRMILQASLWNTTSQQVAGTIRWMAPEFLSQTQMTVSKPGDVYAFGMVAYEIMTGLVPFYECSHDLQVLAAVIHQKKTPSRTSKSQINEQIWVLLQNCWSNAPFKRPVIQHVVDRLRNPGRIAAASEDGSIHLWHATSGEELDVFRGHMSAIFHLAFSSDGTRLASATANGDVLVCHSYTGETIFHALGNGIAIHEIALSPDGTRVTAVSDDARITIWDIESQKQIRSVIAHHSPIYTIAYSLDGNFMATGSLDSTIRLWDKEINQKVLHFAGHKGWVSSVAFSPDGMKLVSGSQDQTVRVWDVQTGKALHMLSGNAGIVRSVAFSPSGEYIAAGSDSGSVILWRWATDSWQEHTTLTGHEREVWCVAFSSDGSTIATASGDRTVRLWDVKSGLVVVAVDGPIRSIRSVAFSRC